MTYILLLKLGRKSNSGADHFRDKCIIANLRSTEFDKALDGYGEIYRGRRIMFVTCDQCFLFCVKREMVIVIHVKRDGTISCDK